MIYLDNCATTQPDPAVLETMNRTAQECFGNPSSIHTVGQKAAATLTQARRIVADSLHATPNEIVFTSSGTEANNLVLSSVIRRCARVQRQCHIVATAVEHASIRERLRYEQQDNPALDVTYVPPDNEGRLDFEQFAKWVRFDTDLITILHCNNETGVLQDLAAIKELKFRFPRALLHLDIIQSYLKIPFDVRELPVDFLTISAHKVYGPKGAGAVFVRNGVELDPLIVGGAQEKFRRAGTENVAAVAGFAEAVKRFPPPGELIQRYAGFEKIFFEKLNGSGAGFVINGPRESGERRIPGTFNISFPGVRNKEDLQIGCDLEGVMVSSTSACHSGVVTESHVLKAMEVPAERTVSALRICFSKYLSADDVQQAAQTIGQVAKRLTN